MSGESGRPVSVHGGIPTLRPPSPLPPAPSPPPIPNRPPLSPPCLPGVADRNELFLRFELKRHSWTRFSNSRIFSLFSLKKLCKLFSNVFKYFTNLAGNVGKYNLQNKNFETAFGRTDETTFACLLPVPVPDTSTLPPLIK